MELSKLLPNSRLRRHATSRTMLLMLLVVLLTVPGTGTAQQVSAPAKEGKITGKLIDAETGEPLIGVTVQLDGTKLGAASDLDGAFTIRRVPLGTYTLVASMIGYSPMRVTEVEVTEAEAARVDLAMKPQVIITQGVTVTAKQVRNNETSLLKLRQNSNSVSDAISAEQISRSGSSDAAAAMTRVTGASVVGGKYVFVRGMGDRYANTRINGALAPSPDPDKQAVPMDMIPAALLDNIIVEKTFTPDKPGNFSGGSVDLTTKDMPEGRVLSFSTSASYNTQTTFESNMLANRPVNGDWLAMSADDRELADWLKEPPAGGDLAYGNVVMDTAKASFLERQSAEINKTKMTPVRRSAPLNQGYNLSYGDSWSLFNMPLGFISSLSYSRNYSYYSGGQTAIRYWADRNSNELFNKQDLRDEQGKEEVLWGGLFNGSLRPHPNHKLGFTIVYNRNGESSARVVNGYEYNVGSEQEFRSQSLTYSERALSTYQFKGEHAQLPLNSRLTWQFATSKSSQDDPDMRFYTDVVDTTGAGGSIWLTYPSHYWRNLDEKNREGRVDFSLPFKQWSGQAAKFKMGASFLHKTRQFREREFKLMSTVGGVPYNQDPDEFLKDENFGIDTVYGSGFILWNLAWLANSSVLGNSDATQDVNAYYAMVELPLFGRLSFVGGARFETTEMDLVQILATQDTLDPIKGEDILPSVNFIYKLTDNMNTRVAYSRTLARPTMREISPHTTWEFVEGGYYSGNAKLKYTKIDNYDARWEWFIRPGEILAVSGFLKRLYDPIERKYTNFNGDQRAVNYARADVYGIELEWRRRLDHVESMPFLKHFRLGGNLTLVHSQVTLPDAEYQEQYNWDPETAEKTRPFQGQSPYVINADISYDNDESGTNVSLMFNRFGKRLSALTLGVTPDIYEQARSTLDLTLSQKIWSGISLKASGKNLTNSEYREFIDVKGREYTTRSYSSGVTYGFGITYSL